MNHAPEICRSSAPLSLEKVFNNNYVRQKDDRKQGVADYTEEVFNEQYIETVCAQKSQFERDCVN